MFFTLWQLTRIQGYFSNLLSVFYFLNFYWYMLTILCGTCVGQRRHALTDLLYIMITFLVGHWFTYITHLNSFCTRFPLLPPLSPTSISWSYYLWGSVLLLKFRVSECLHDHICQSYPSLCNNVLWCIVYPVSVPCYLMSVKHSFLIWGLCDTLFSWSGAEALKGTLHMTFVPSAHFWLVRGKVKGR